MLNIRRRMSLPIELRSTRWSRHTACSNLRLFFALAFGFSPASSFPARGVGVRKARQSLAQCCNRPDLVIPGAGLRDAGHARHVDAVLDHPEQLGRGEFTSDFLQVRRIGM